MDVTDARKPSGYIFTPQCQSTRLQLDRPQENTLMDRVNKLACPKCHAPLKSGRGVRIGKSISCPGCGTAFVVGPEVGGVAGKVNPGRLAVIAIWGLLLLAAGAGLACYCFVANAQSPALERAGVPVAAPSQPAEPELPPPSPPPLSSAVDAVQARKIDDAIADGVWYLKDHMLPAGTWGDNTFGRLDISVGFAALPGLTLLECGVPANDPVVQKAAQLVRSRVVQLGAGHDNFRGSTTYQRALAILFLDRLGQSQREFRDSLGHGQDEMLVGRATLNRTAAVRKPEDTSSADDESLIQYLALCLIAGQHPVDGGWTYYTPALDRALVPQLRAMLRDHTKRLADWRRSALKGGTFLVPTWDNSNTQFAVLALWVARRHGVDIDRSIQLLEKQLRANQQPDGRWYYSLNDHGGNPWPSMTCSGLLGLAVAHAVTADPNEKKQKPLDDPAIRRGFTLLASEVDLPDETRKIDHYFLWSLERVGVLYQLPKINDKDWYGWGRQLLLSRQQQDGSWDDAAWYGNNPVTDTCFALLFLKQANLAQDLTQKLQLLASRK
jgi:hypothetical protein